MFITSNRNPTIVGITWQRALRWLAAFGILHGIGLVLYVINMLWIHAPMGMLLIFVPIVSLIFLCVLMITTEARSFLQICIWIGVSITLIATLFILLGWPGGGILTFTGLFTSIITTLYAILYLHYMPQDYRWAKNALGSWIIGLQIANMLFWIAHWYYINNYVDSFEPIIPYADDAIVYIQMRRATKIIAAVTIAPISISLSIWLYIVAKRKI